MRKSKQVERLFNPYRYKGAAQERECLRKVYFKTESEATVAAMRESKPHKPISAYRCRFCPGWHIGTPKGAWYV